LKLFAGKKYQTKIKQPNWAAFKFMTLEISQRVFSIIHDKRTTLSIYYVDWNRKLKPYDPYI
jgi:hypothetical protein